MAVRDKNLRMLLRMLVIAAGMFSFGYAMVPIYRVVCDALGINVLSLNERGRGKVADAARIKARNTQIDYSRTITVQFDANTTGPWHFKPARRTVDVHPGELATVMYEFQNVQDRRMTAQAIPSYAPQQAAAHFNKIECFCFSQYTLDAGEKKEWPVTFVIDPKLTKDVRTITLSYTFFEVGGRTPPAPGTASVSKRASQG